MLSSVPIPVFFPHLDAFAGYFGIVSQKLPFTTRVPYRPHTAIPTMHQLYMVPAPYPYLAVHFACLLASSVGRPPTHPRESPGRKPAGLARRSFPAGVEEFARRVKSMRSPAGRTPGAAPHEKWLPPSPSKGEEDQGGDVVPIGRPPGLGKLLSRVLGGSLRGPAPH